MYQATSLLEKLILKYPDKDWNWSCISANPNITLEFIDAYPEKPWEWSYVSINPNVTVEFINKNFYKDLNFKNCHLIKILLLNLLKKIQINHRSGIILHLIQI